MGISTINRAQIISVDLVISVNGGCFLCTPVSLQQKQVRAVNRRCKFAFFLPHRANPGTSMRNFNFALGIKELRAFNRA